MHHDKDVNHRCFAPRTTVSLVRNVTNTLDIIIIPHLSCVLFKFLNRFIASEHQFNFSIRIVN